MPPVHRISCVSGFSGAAFSGLPDVRWNSICSASFMKWSCGEFGNRIPILFPFSYWVVGRACPGIGVDVSRTTFLMTLIEGCTLSAARRHFCLMSGQEIWVCLHLVGSLLNLLECALILGGSCSFSYVFRTYPTSSLCVSCRCQIVECEANAERTLDLHR